MLPFFMYHDSRSYTETALLIQQHHALSKSKHSYLRISIFKAAFTPSLKDQALCGGLYQSPYNIKFGYSRSVRSKEIFLSLLSTDPTLTPILSPSARNSSTLLILLFAIFEICKRPSRPGKIFIKAP